MYFEYLFILNIWW